MIDQAAWPGSPVSAVARKYGIAARVLLHWRKDISPDPQLAPPFADMKLGEIPAGEAAMGMPSSLPKPPAAVVRTLC